MNSPTLENHATQKTNTANIRRRVYPTTTTPNTRQMRRLQATQPFETADQSTQLQLTPIPGRERRHP